MDGKQKSKKYSIYILRASAILALMFAGLKHFLQDVHLDGVVFFLLAIFRYFAEYSEIDGRLPDGTQTNAWVSLLARSVCRNCCQSPIWVCGIFQDYYRVFFFGDEKTMADDGGPHDGKTRRVLCGGLFCTNVSVSRSQDECTLMLGWLVVGKLSHKNFDRYCIGTRKAKRHEEYVVFTIGTGKCCCWEFLLCFSTVWARADQLQLRIITYVICLCLLVKSSSSNRFKTMIGFWVYSATFTTVANHN